MRADYGRETLSETRGGSAKNGQILYDQYVNAYGGQQTFSETYTFSKNYKTVVIFLSSAQAWDSGPSKLQKATVTLSGTYDTDYETSFTVKDLNRNTGVAEYYAVLQNVKSGATCAFNAYSSGGGQINAVIVGM